MASLPQNAQAIWTYLRSVGLSPAAAAGILGNIGQESGGNPQAGWFPGSYGLIQWTPATPAHGYPYPGPTGLQQQLPAVIEYINRNGSISDINAHSPTPQAGALYFSQYYERPNPAEANNANRQAVAQLVYQTAQSGNWKAPSGTPPSVPGTTGTATAAPAPSATNPGGATGGTGSSGQGLSVGDLYRLQYMSAIATYGPGLFDPTSDTSAALTSAVGQGGVMETSSVGNIFKWIFGNLPMGAIGLTPTQVPGGSTIIGEPGKIIGGAEHAAGMLTWIFGKYHMLRVLEVIAGAALVGVGLALYVDILVPGVGGVVGTVAGVAAPEIGAARSVSRRTTRTPTRAARRVDRGANQARIGAVRETELRSRELRAASSHMRAERGFMREIQPPRSRSVAAGSGGPEETPW